MQEKILTFIEKNSRIDLKDLALMLGVDEASVMNELEAMEQEGIICGYHTLINWYGIRQGCGAYLQLSGSEFGLPDLRWI